MDKKIPLNFGIARGTASLAYGIFTSVIGTIVLYFSESSIPISLLIIDVIFFLSVVTFRFASCGESCVAPSSEAKTALASGNMFRKYPFLLFLILATCCLFISHNIMSIYFYQIVQRLGGNSSHMGTVILIESLWELPGMFGFSWLLTKASCRKWLMLSGLGFFLHASSIFLSPSIPILYLVQIFELPGYAIFMVASVIFINESMEECDKVQGQAYVAMAMTLGSVLTSLMGGVILDHFGVFLLLALASAFGAIGMLLQYFSLRKDYK